MTQSRAGSRGEHVPPLLLVIVLLFVFVAGTAMMHTSTTFDEILFPADGARGYATGDFGMVRDHPPVMQYVYGLPLRAMPLRYPPEAGHAWNFSGRYEYARALLWGSGNDPGAIIFASRAVAVVLGALLVLSAYAVTRRALGTGGALLAALLVALLPEVLAHAGVTYNDLPATLAFFLAVFALDRAVRAPSLPRVILAAVATALAMGVKTSAIVALPVLLVLLVFEAFSGRVRDPAWRRGILLAVPVFAAVLYLSLVAICLGDFTLEAFLRCLRENIALSGAGRPAYMLGSSSEAGFWYYFPVAFFLKTPVALHALAALAAVAAWLAWRGRDKRELLRHPLRAAAVAAALFTAVLMTSRINLGFRHAMPVLPFVCVLVAAGVAWLWQRGAKALRIAVVALVAGNAISALAVYPHFLPYISEYARHRPAYETLPDSSTDWGQGLMALDAFMRERGIRQVYLGYTGTALPEAYGIRYVGLPSFFELPPYSGRIDELPRHIAVSSSLVTGLYVKGDPYAELRGRRPIALLAGSILVYDLP